MTAEEKAAGAEEAKASGNALLASGDARGAAAAYEEGWALVEYETPATGEAGDKLRAVKAALRSNAALAHLKAKDWAAAAKAAKAAVGLLPGDAKPLFRLGSALAHLGDLDEAKEALKSAQKLAPADAAIRAELARVKDLEGAEKAKAKACGALDAGRGAWLGAAIPTPPPSARPPPPQNVRWHFCKEGAGPQRREGGCGRARHHGGGTREHRVHHD